MAIARKLLSNFKPLVSFPKSHTSSLSVRCFTAPTHVWGTPDWELTVLEARIKEVRAEKAALEESIAAAKAAERRFEEAEALARMASGMLEVWNIEKVEAETAEQKERHAALKERISQARTMVEVSERKKGDAERAEKEESLAAWKAQRVVKEVIEEAAKKRVAAAEVWKREAQVAVGTLHPRCLY